MQIETIITFFVRIFPILIAVSFYLLYWTYIRQHRSLPWKLVSFFGLVLLALGYYIFFSVVFVPNEWGATALYGGAAGWFLALFGSLLIVGRAFVARRVKRRGSVN